MKPRHQLLAEIAAYRSWRGPALAPGVAGHLHKPQLYIRVSYTNSAEYKREAVMCLCGWNPQQKRTLEEELSSVLLHIVERQIEAERKLEQMRETHYEAGANV